MASTLTICPAVKAHRSRIGDPSLRKARANRLLRTRTISTLEYRLLRIMPHLCLRFGCQKQSVEMESWQSCRQMMSRTLPVPTFSVKVYEVSRSSC